MTVMCDISKPSLPERLPLFTTTIEGVPEGALPQHRSHHDLKKNSQLLCTNTKTKIGNLILNHVL